MAETAGQKVGDFMNGILSPVGGFATGLMGKTTTTETTGQGAGAADNKRTGIIIIAVIAVITIFSIGYLLIKKS